MKNLILLALVLVTGALSAQTARLQLIHNSPETTVDIYVNDSLFLSDFVFRDATSFINVIAGYPVTLAVAASPSSSSADSVFAITVNFNENESYVAVASGVVGDAVNPFNVWVIDSMRESALAPGSIDFIGVHGAFDTYDIDIIARGMAILFKDVEYGDISDYRTISAESYVLDVTPSNNNFDILTSFSANLSSLGGTSAVLFASGYIGGSPSFGLYAALADGTVVEFSLEMPVYTNLQVIHNSPGPNVDIYVNNTLVIDNFSFRTATPFVPVQGYVPVKIDVAPAGSSNVSESFYTLTGSFRNPEKCYVAIANGIVGDFTTPFNVVLQGNIRLSNSVGQVQFVASHGVPDAPAIDIIADDAVTLVSDLGYDSISRYIGVLPLNYTLDIRPAGDPTTLVSFDADLSAFGGVNAVVFASGYLGLTPSLGLFAALTDGTVIEFPMTMPRLAGEVTFEGLFPTVATEQVTLILSGTAEDQVGLSVYNALGQMVLAEAANVDNGRITHQLNVSNLTPGQYFVTVLTNEGLRTQRFVKAQ